MRALLDSYCPTSFPGEQRRSSIIGVIHFAAFKAVEESIRQPLKCYQNKINGLVDLLTLLNEYNIKNFIFSSSAAVYGPRPTVTVSSGKSSVSIRTKRSKIPTAPSNTLNKAVLA
jgi:UDP-glucose 4-epimerase